MAVLTLTPAFPRGHLLLAHGAGAGILSPFMQTITHLLVDRGIGVTGCEFAYMAEQRASGKKRPPPSMARLAAEFAAALATFRRAHSGITVHIGGKSMGGRVASLVADAAFERGDIAGLVCLGYPFHPPKQPGLLRTAHLLNLRCPALIVQGTRDPFGTRSEVESYGLPQAIQMHWAEDGDHDLAPRRRSGLTLSSTLVCAADAIARFIKGV